MILQIRSYKFLSKIRIEAIIFFNVKEINQVLISRYVLKKKSERNNIFQAYYANLKMKCQTALSYCPIHTLYIYALFTGNKIRHNLLLPSNFVQNNTLPSDVVETCGWYFLGQKDLEQNALFYFSIILSQNFIMVNYMTKIRFLNENNKEIIKKSS